MDKTQTLAAQVADTDVKCRQALAAASDAKERGAIATAARHEERAQRLLDKLNRLEERLWLLRRGA
jgi:hypothetical protein